MPGRSLGSVVPVVVQHSKGTYLAARIRRRRRRKIGGVRRSCAALLPPDQPRRLRPRMDPPGWRLDSDAFVIVTGFWWRTCLVPMVLLLTFFLFQSKIGLRRPAIRRRSLPTPPKDELVATPFQVAATMLVIKPLPLVSPPSSGGSSTDSRPLGTTGRPPDALG